MEDVPPLASGIPVHCAHHAIVPLHDLKPRPGNPNEHPETQLVLYAAAIKARGWRESITVSRRSGFIVTGEGALLAARRLGVDSALVEYQDFESEEEELADLVAHNRLPELSRTDLDLLKSVIEQLSPGGLAITAGFADDAVAKILAEKLLMITAVTNSLPSRLWLKVRRLVTWVTDFVKTPHESPPPRAAAALP